MGNSTTRGVNVRPELSTALTAVFTPLARSTFNVTGVPSDVVIITSELRVRKVCFDRLSWCTRPVVRSSKAKVTTSVAIEDKAAGRGRDLKSLSASAIRVLMTLVVNWTAGDA